MLDIDNKTRVTVSPNVNTIDAVNGPFQNGAMQYLSEMKYAPYRHTAFSFIGQEAPTASTYTDEAAPIGSMFCWLETLDGVVVGAHDLCKTASNTWQSKTNAVRQATALGTTAQLDGDVFESDVLALKTSTATAGFAPAGTQLVINGDTFTVVRGGAISASGTVTVSVDAKVTASDDDLVSATNQMLAFSHDKFLNFTTGDATALNLPPVAEAAGARIVVFNGSGATVTADPDAAELIDGGASLAIVDGVETELFCNGVVWTSNTLAP